MTSTLKLIRDKGYIFLNTLSNGKEIYWMTFDSGGHIGWIYYIQISKNEFRDLWDEKISCSDLRGKYSDSYMTAEESKKIEVEYDIRSVVKEHKLPPAMEQMFYKSEIEKDS